MLNWLQGLLFALGMARDDISRESGAARTLLLRLLPWMAGLLRITPSSSSCSVGLLLCHTTLAASQPGTSLSSSSSSPSNCGSFQCNSPVRWMMQTQLRWVCCVLVNNPAVCSNKWARASDYYGTSLSKLRKKIVGVVNLLA